MANQEQEQEQEQDKNLALFADAKAAGQGEVSRPKRGRPPKDQSPEAQVEREAEKADADRWITAARELIGLTPEEAPWSSATFMAFRQMRKKRGMDQLMRALDGLAGDRWASQQGIGTLLSATLIEKGLAGASKRAYRIASTGIGINAEWEGIVEGAND